MAYTLKYPDTIKKRIEDGEIIEQKIWQLIRELNSFDEDHLNADALVDGIRTYTYRQMFRKWDQYAEVFSALDITGRNESRAGLLPDFSTEAIFSLYALNMTGASVSIIHPMDFLDLKRWEKMLEVEGITDLVLCDTLLTPKTLESLVSSMDRCGLRNIIVLHSAGKSRFAYCDTGLPRKTHYKMLKEVRGALFMKDLLKKYEAYPVVSVRDVSRDDAVILHTSGTTSGIHKPVPLSDRGINEAVVRLLRTEQFQSFEKPLSVMMMLDITTAFPMIDMLHLPLAFGGRVIIVRGGLTNPMVPFLIPEYQVNILFMAKFLIDIIAKIPVRFDFSSIEYIFVGGVQTSADTKKRMESLMRRYGCKAGVSNGYGCTETGAASILASPDRDDDAIGYPLPGVKVKIFDEVEEKYYNLEDGPRTGVLLISSPSVSSGAFNGTTFFELEEIDGEKYYNTYDLVTVNEDGSISCIGRMNKYFVNNEGIRFDAGLVEAAVGAEPNIETCGLAPVYDKMLHDTVPVLYVRTAAGAGRDVEVVRKALCNVFIRDNKLEETNMPEQCVITKNIPCSASGKVDVVRISKGEVSGRKYRIKPVRRGGRVVDLILKPERGEAGTPGVTVNGLGIDMEAAVKEAFRVAFERAGMSLPCGGTHGHDMSGQDMYGQNMPGMNMPGWFLPGCSMPGCSSPVQSAQGQKMPGTSKSGRNNFVPPACGRGMPGQFARSGDMPYGETPGRGMPGNNIPGCFMPGQASPGQYGPGPFILPGDILQWFFQFFPF
ncbi:MAG: AMP-binding protein [Eubacteriales bacterium]|nr:AMP-binding protein [Eubacteriales bacterium]